MMGFFVGGFAGQIIFIVGLSAGVPLAVAFFTSEIWNATHAEHDALPAGAETNTSA
jgi:hypothetical protein